MCGHTRKDKIRNGMQGDIVLTPTGEKMTKKSVKVFWRRVKKDHWLGE